MLALQLQGNGMEFASEMVVKATLNKLTIAEVPTTLAPDGRSRRPHLRPWRDGWRHLRLLLLFSPRWLFFYPGLMLMLTGVVLMLTLALSRISIAGVNFDIHTMLFSSVFTIVGMQAFCFAVFADLIAKQQMNLPQRIQLPIAFTLERGLIIGAVVFTVGMLGACYSFYIWMQHGFGSLAPTQMMRLLIPATTAVVIGLQCVLASFFMSLLGLHYHH